MTIVPIGGAGKKACALPTDAGAIKGAALLTNASLGSSTEAAGYRADIDGLRAIAVLPVILFHAHVAGFSGGFVGVDVFFVISGYLIGGILNREVSQQRFSFAKFYARRAKRILPALLFMLLCLYLITALVLTPGELTHFGENAVATVLAVSNVFLWRDADYFTPSAETNPLLMTWSLGVEEQFYLFFPVVLLVLHRFRASLLAALGLLCIASLILCVLLTRTHPSAAFYMLPARAWELGIGALLAVSEVRGNKRAVSSARLSHVLSILGLALIVTSVLCFDNGTAFPGYMALVPALGAAALIASRDGVVNRWLLSRRAIVFIGLISYSWYLWHWPMLSLARVVANRSLSPPLSFIVAVCSFFPAVLSWRFVERPFRTSRVSVRPLLWSYAAALLIFLVPAVMMIHSNGWPSRFSPAVMRVEQAIQQEQSDPCLRAYGVAKPNWSAQCLPSNATAEGWVLLGDSHAAALAPGLRALAKDNRLEFYELTKSSCPPLLHVTRYMPDHQGHDAECATFNRQALDYVRQNQNIKLVLLAGYWTAPFIDESAGQRFVREGDNPSSVSIDQSRANLSIGLAQAVDTLQAAGKRVLLVRDTPRFNFNPAREVQTAAMPVRTWLMQLLLSREMPYREAAPKTALENREEVVDSMFAQLAARYPELVIVDPWSSLCSRDGCRFSDGSTVYYADNQHLSPAGAEFAFADRRVSGYVLAKLKK